ncbi:MAG: hypothetical protein HW385_1448, partial [candidate division NC10 bacterium]|nr:hypothetical protein [candidate division NC10 bacterium]
RKFFLGLDDRLGLPQAVFEPGHLVLKRLLLPDQRILRGRAKISG